MREANSMIENERKRNQKIQDEELKRIKEIGEWEKKKLMETHQAEVQSLKSQLSVFQTRAGDSTKGMTSIEMDKK